MKHKLLLQAKDLENWSDTRVGQEQLPILIRRLIRSNARGLTRSQFASDDSIHLGGWDGIVCTQEHSEWVPAGISGWELSVDKDVKGKADRDYLKRKDNSLGLEPTGTIYVAATSRRWASKEEWANSKRSEGFWKDVRAYDSSDLVSWLEAHPTLELWMSRFLSKLPPGVSDLWHFWHQWSQDFQVDEEVLLAGRWENQTELLTWLTGGAGTISLQAETLDEAIGFTYAAIQSLPIETRDILLSCSVRVENQEQFDRLSATQSCPLLLVPAYPRPRGIKAAEQQGHRILIPLSADNPKGAGIRLRPPRVDLLRKALEKFRPDLGRRVEAVAAIGHKSLSAMQRVMTDEPAIYAPKWLKPEVVADLLPAFLAGSWRSSSEPDKNILSALADRPSEEYTRLLRNWSKVEDPFLTLTGDAWVVVARAAVWDSFAAYLDVDVLTRFWDSCVLCLFGGKQCSHLLRAGLLESITLLAARSETSEIQEAGTGQEWADRIVTDLLERPTKSEDWALICLHAEAFAEASPGPFIDAVERAIEPNGFLRNCYHSSDLSQDRSWELTCLIRGIRLAAWSPAQFEACTLLLARLGEEGWQLKTAIEALKHIFEAVAPEVCSAFADRLRALDGMRRKAPSVAWRLMHLVLPFHQRVFHYQHLRHRAELKHGWDESNFGELYAYVHSILARILDDAGVDVARWIEVVPLLNKMSSEHFELALIRMARLIPGLEFEQRAALADQLARQIGSYYTHGSENWTLTEQQANQCELLYSSLQPTDVSLGAVWRFQRDLSLVQQPERDWEAAFHRRLDWQRRVAKESYEQGGHELLRRMLDLGVSALDLGAASSRAGLSYEDTLSLLSECLGEDGPPGEFGLNLLFGISKTSQEMFSRIVGGDEFKKWSPTAKADYVRCLPFSRESWELLRSLGPETTERYWTKVGIGLVDLEVTDELFVAKRLTEHGRAAEALERLSYKSYWRKRDGKLKRLKRPKLPVGVLEVLAIVEAFLAQTSLAQIKHPHYLVELLDAVTKRERAAHRTRFEAVERELLRQNFESGFKPLTLHERLAAEPRFFYEQVMESDGEGRDGTGDSVATNLINSFRRVTNQMGRLSLVNWVSRVRSLAVGPRELYLIDSRVGGLLACSLPDKDNDWPNEIVRDAIEKVASADLELGIRHGLTFLKGLTCRGALDGGEPERMKEADCRRRADKFRPKWPRCAGMLDKLADEFKRAGMREDRHVEFHQAVWNIH